MALPTIDLSPLHKAIDALAEALECWRLEPDDSRRKPHLRAGVIQSFEFCYELAVRLLRRTLMERALVPPAVADLSFNDLLRLGADAGLLPDALGWRRWRELRNRTSHSYDETLAEEIVAEMPEFLADVQALRQRLANALAP